MNFPVSAEESQVDREHLRLLSLFHYIVGALSAVFACFPLIHVGVGLVMLISPEIFAASRPAPPEEKMMGVLFVVMGGLFFIIGQAMAICVLFSGRYIAQRRKHLFVFVTGCIQCMFFPFGTALGVFTIIVLSRESVRQAFGLARPDMATAKA